MLNGTWIIMVMGGQVSMVRRQENNFKENSLELELEHHIDGPIMLFCKIT